jgi:hypothetical protein
MQPKLSPRAIRSGEVFFAVPGFVCADGPRSSRRWLVLRVAPVADQARLELLPLQPLEQSLNIRYVASLARIVGAPSPAMQGAPLLGRNLSVLGALQIVVVRLDAPHSALARQCTWQYHCEHQKGRRVQTLHVVTSWQTQVGLPHYAEDR